MKSWSQESRKGLGFLRAEKLVSPVQRKASERESPAGYVTDLSDKYLLGTTPPPCACPTEAARKDRVAACFLKRRGDLPFPWGAGGGACTGFGAEVIATRKGALLSRVSLGFSEGVTFGRALELGV